MVNPLISIITVTRNSLRTVKDTIDSVLRQSYNNIEYIIIDGASTDGTKELISSYGNKITKFVSEPDKGIYDAINKGINMASGEIIGIINSDDFYCNERIIEIIATKLEDPDVDAIYGDAIFVDKVNTGKVIRNYSSRNFNPAKFRYGYMPAHPSFYVRKIFFEKLGLYNPGYRIGADFDLLVRFLYVNRLRYKYIEIPFLYMRMGGISNKNIYSKIILNREIARACRENNIKTNYFLIYSKYLTKVFEFLAKKRWHELKPVDNVSHLI